MEREGRFGSLDFEPPKPEGEQKTQAQKEGQPGREESPPQERPPGTVGEALGLELRPPLEVEIEPPASGQIFWEAEVEGTVSALAYVMGTGLFVGTGGPGRRGALFLLDHKTGEAKWALDLRSPVSALSFGSGDVFVSAVRAHGPGGGLWDWLRRLAQLEGWMMEATEEEVPSPPEGTPPVRRLDLVVAGTLDGEVWFVGAHGEALFAVRLNSEPASIAPGKQVFYIGTERGTVYAFNPYEPSFMERPLWRSKICERCVGLRLSEDGLFVACRERDGGVLCLMEVASGGALWKVGLDAPPLSIEAGGRRMYVGTLKGAVCAFDPLFGEPLWRAEMGGPAGKLLLSGERLFVGTEEGVVALDTSLGEVAWEAGLDGAATALEVEGAKLLALSRKWGQPDSLVCLSASSGERLWSVGLGSEAPALDAGDGLAFVGLQGKVVAVGV